MTVRTVIFELFFFPHDSMQEVLKVKYIYYYYIFYYYYYYYYSTTTSTGGVGGVQQVSQFCK